MSLDQIPAMASVPPRSSARSATGTSSPAGAKRIAPSSGSGGASVGPADRVDTELAGQRLVVLAPGQDVHPQTLRQRDLSGQVRATAESVDPEPSTGWHSAARTRARYPMIPAQSNGAACLVVEPLRERVRVRLVDQAVRRRTRRRRPSR